MSRALEFARPLLHGLWGNILEADLFESLRRCPEVVRAFEFALADGAIDCTRRHAMSDSYAERFWDFHHRGTAGGGEFALFDIKANIHLDTRDQQCYSTLGQQRRVAFFLCVHAANLGYVDLVPNFHQVPGALTSPVADCEREYVSITVRGRTRLFPGAHDSLDLTGTSYRLPLRLLPEAIRRVSAHILGARVYANPWTGVSFPDWRPLTTDNTSWLKPAESNDHYTGFHEIMKLYPAIRLDPYLELDFIGLQPLLADFKLIARGEAQISQPSVPLVQRFVQHKIDGHVRARGAPLTKVAISRGETRYFDACNRWVYHLFAGLL
jgi:hypothetical protein